jgi:Flp pilus assembly protein TadG
MGMIMKVFKHKKRSNPARSGEEGSALVELALSVPILSFMLLGATEFARVAYAGIEVNNAAHAAAVYASSSQAAATDSTGITNAATSDSGNLTGGNAVSVTSVDRSCTCSNTSYTPTSCSDNSTCFDHNSAMITTVTVQTQATYSPIIRIPGSPTSFTLHGQSSQVVSNQ